MSPWTLSEKVRAVNYFHCSLLEYYEGITLESYWYSAVGLLFVVRGHQRVMGNKEPHPAEGDLHIKLDGVPPSDSEKLVPLEVIKRSTETSSTHLL